MESLRDRATAHLKIRAHPPHPCHPRSIMPRSIMPRSIADLYFCGFSCFDPKLPQIFLFFYLRIVKINVFLKIFKQKMKILKKFYYFWQIQFK
jgi:hypothetical protein